MFREEKCLIPVCDACGRDVDEDAEMKPHYSTEHEAREMLDLSECYEIDGKLLCASCWEFDDEGERVPRTSPTGAGKEEE